MMKSVLAFLFFICNSFANAQQQKVHQPLRFLALGDSYTIGQSVAVKDRWPVQLKDSLIARGVAFDTLKIIATTGWRTDNLINAINSAKPDSSFNLVSILIGVNNQYQGYNIANYVPDLITLINRAIALAGNDTAAVFLVSIPDYAYTPYGQETSNPSKISAEIDQYNSLMDSVAQTYGINYFYITDISRQGLNDPALVANDGLHPSGKMYTQFVNEILDSIKILRFQNMGVNKKNSEIDIRIIQQDSNTLKVVFPEEYKAKITSAEVIDLNGKSMLIQQLIKDSIVSYVSVADLKAGAYILILRGENNIHVSEKFVFK